jgi:hypothetical protein
VWRRRVALSVVDAARILEVSEDQVRQRIASDAIPYATLANREHRVQIREEHVRESGNVERQFILVSIGEAPPWISEPTRAVLPDLQTRDPIAKLVLHAKQDAVAPGAGIIRGLAEPGLRGGRGSAIPRTADRSTLLVASRIFCRMRSWTWTAATGRPAYASEVTRDRGRERGSV